jgi:hypothetical protein
MDTNTKPSVVLRDAAAAAARVAVQQAVVNAAKPGPKTSEFWTSILLPAAAAAGTVALKVLGGAALVSMPWLAVPLAALAAGVGSFGYSASRGNVKAAALDAAAAASKAAIDALEAQP